MQKTRKYKLLLIAGVTVTIALLLMLALSGGNLTLLKSLFSSNLSNEELSNELRGFGWRGYIVVTALAALQVICTFLPAEPVQVLGGFTFGLPVGLLCCMIGVLVGNTLIYMIQKLFGERMRDMFIKKMNLDLDKISRSSKAVLIIFILYFLPAIPYGMICFFAAGIGLSYRRYIVVTGLGSLPSVFMGVGLGHLAIVFNSTTLICILAVLILLIVVMFFKKNALFSKLNHYADKHKKAPANKVREVNGFLLNFLYYMVRAFLFLRGVRIRTRNKVGNVKAPAIVLCNHGSFIDFAYATALLRKQKPHFIAARLYFYNKYLGAILRKVGAFPKSMFAMDMENAKNCLEVLKKNGVLAMMPEARLSTVGRFEDIQGSTYSFIKRSGVDIYTIKIDGDYLADPKWGKGLRRGAVVEAELDILFTAEQVKSLSMEQIRQSVEDRLRYDELQWLQQRPQIRYRSSRMAEGLENILHRCPLCGGKHTIMTKKNKIFCENCGYVTSLDRRYGFTDDFRFENFAQWYDWQKAIMEKEILENEHYALTSEVELRLPGTGKGLTRHSGHGVCTLDRDGLVYSGTKDGETVELRFSIQRIYRLLFGAGENFEIYDGTQILYFVPKERRSAVDWYMASMILHDRAAEKVE